MLTRRWGGKCVCICWERKVDGETAHTNKSILSCLSVWTTVVNFIHTKLREGECLYFTNRWRLDMPRLYFTESFLNLLLSSTSNISSTSMPSLHMSAAGSAARCIVSALSTTFCCKIVLSLMMWPNRELFTNQATDTERTINNSVRSALLNSWKYQWSLDEMRYKCR